MTKEDEKVYNNFFELFRTEGWKQLIKDFQDHATLTNSVETVEDAKDLFVRQGKLQMIALILNYEEVITAMYEQAQQDSEESDENAE